MKTRKRSRDYVDVGSLLKRMSSALTAMRSGAFCFAALDKDLTHTAAGVTNEIDESKICVVDNDTRFFVRCVDEKTLPVSTATAELVCNVVSELNFHHYFIVPPHALKTFQNVVQKRDDVCLFWDENEEVHAIESRLPSKRGFILM